MIAPDKARPNKSLVSFGVAALVRDDRGNGSGSQQPDRHR